MPELKNNFTRGRMNKDLDDRLVPKGEYRDATNIQVSTSEGSDVGAIESVLGNSKIASKPGGGNWANDFGLANPEAIGVCVDTKNEKIYWFIAADNEASVVMEYDQATNIVTPVLVDVRTGANNVLNFSKSNLITGVNIIDGLLFWTDNLNEPKKINIDTFKNASAGTDIDGTALSSDVTLGGNTLVRSTRIYEYSGTAREFLESDVVLIRKAPSKALKVNSYATALSESKTFGTIINPATTTKNFNSGAPNFGPLSPGSTTKITIDGTENLTLFTTDSEIVLKGFTEEVDQSRSNYIVEAKILSGSAGRDLNIQIISANDAPMASISWNIVIKEGDPIFKDEFARFSYRFKYYDGEYSPYAPFSTPAFIPVNFSYSQSESFNEGMENQIRKVKLSNFQEINGVDHRDVKAVELLYKSSKSNNVYEIDVFNRATYNVSPFTYSILNTPTGPVIESNQLIRPFDAVPRKALAQEIVGNRVVFANYLQNYTISDGVDNVALSAVVSSSTPTIVEKIGSPSVKSNRDYQLGITWIDKFGRETPVFTKQAANITVNKNASAQDNTLKGKVITSGTGSVEAPSWATHYKFYVKDAAAGYHNLAMDRFYFAEDGNVWISFPSSERNKIEKDEYILLKKEHDTDNAVKSNDNRFKVLDISNEVPDFVKTKKMRAGVAEIYVTSKPGVDYKSFNLGSRIVKFRGPTAQAGEQFHAAFNDNSGIQFFTEDWQTSSKLYGIESGGPTGQTQDAITSPAIPETAEFVLKLEDLPSTTDVAFTTLGPTGIVKINAVIYKNKTVPLPEYEGRFFVKIAQNSILRTAVIGKIQDILRVDRTIDQEIDGFLNLYNPLTQSYSGSGTSGSFNVPIMPRQVESGVEFNSKVSLLQNNNGLGIYAGYGDLQATDKTVAMTQSVQQGYFRSQTDTRNFSIPGETYKKPRANSAKFSVGFVAGMTNDFEKLFGTTNFKYPNSTMGPFTPPYDPTLKPGANLTDAQKQLHNNFDKLKPGTQIRFKNINGDAGQIFTIVEATEHYYLREPSLGFRNDKTGLLDLADPAPIVCSSVGRKIDITLDRPLSAGFTAGFGIQILKPKIVSDGEIYTSNNPAVFETEPKERADIDLYYEASDAIPTAHLTSKGSNSTVINGVTYAGDSLIPLEWFNCYAFNNGVESMQIRDDFNSAAIGKGVRVSSIIKEPYNEERRKAGLIYSGILNSLSGVNNTNQFIIGEKITKDLNPIYGSIQKLSTRGAGAQGDLLTLCEDKCFRILANKDALFNADGNANLTSTNTVLGQAIPFAGEYGISKNPESFASFGFRSYFTDKARGAILRLSADGLTDISAKGMSDFFQDKLSTQTGNYIGSYDKNTSAYIIGLGNECYSFKEGVDGWNTRLTYKPEMGASLNNIYYTYKTGEIFKHTNTTRSQFYGTSNNTSVTTLLNDNPSKIKNFKTVLYEGDTGWQCTVSTNENNGFVYTGSKGKWGNKPGTTPSARDKEGIYYGWIRGLEIRPNDDLTVGAEFAMQGIGNCASAETIDAKFQIVFGRVINTSLQVGDIVYYVDGNGDTQISGIVFSILADRKTITLTPSDGGTLPEAFNFVFFVKDNEINTSGIIGYYAELTFTNPLQNKNELFAVGSEIFISS